MDLAAADLDAHREFIRQGVNGGWIDLGDAERMRAFIRLFAGTVDAIVALETSLWLGREPDLLAELWLMAEPTPETLQQYKRWRTDVVGLKE